MDRTRFLLPKPKPNFRRDLPTFGRNENENEHKILFKVFNTYINIKYYNKY